MNTEYQSSIVQKWKHEYAVDHVGSGEIKVFKGNKIAKAHLQMSRECKKPKPHVQLPSCRQFSCDTESWHHLSDQGQWVQPSPLDDKQMMRYVGDLRTDIITLAFDDESRDTLLHTSELEHPITALLDYIWPLYAEHDKKKMHEQKPVRQRKDGDRRDGRADILKPVLCTFHNLTYDIGRLMRKHLSFLRSVVSAREETYRFMIGEYEIEVARGVYTGSAPFFEWYVRKNDEIIRLVGRDLFGYVKNSLKEIGESFFPDQPEMWKHDIETGTFNLPYEDIVAGATTSSLHDKYGMEIIKDIENFVSTPIETLWDYAKQDPKLTLRTYMKITEILSAISPVAIGRDGMIPASAPACAARLAASFASEDTWELATRDIQQNAATTYCGAYVDSRKIQSIENAKVRDITSSYPFIMSQLPNPANCTYEELYPQAFTQDTFEYLKGQFGYVVFSGEGYDDRRPATRTHDCENNRLIYQYGKIDCSFTTIQELLYGVASKRLRVDAIHTGHIIRTVDGESYLQLYINEMFQIKTEAKLSGNKPLELLAKILMNALYGKLLELRRQTTRLNAETLTLKVPVFEYTSPVLGENNISLEKRFATPLLIPELEKIYIEKGGEGVEEFVDALWTHCDTSPDTESSLYKSYERYKDILIDLAFNLHEHIDFYEEGNDISLKDLMSITDTSTWTAGTYYNPIFGCCITGGAAARASLLAHCINAQQVDTDSVIYETPDYENDIMNEYHLLEEYCGYVSPREGLGSWDLEMMEAKGKLLKNKMYYLQGIDSKGKPKTKIALHGMSGMPKRADTNGNYPALAYMDELVEKGKTEYISKASPESLKIYALHMTGVMKENETFAKEAGTWLQEKRSMSLVVDPNQWIDEKGERHWKPFVEQEWLKKEREKLRKRDRYYDDGYQPKSEYMRYSMSRSNQPLVGVNGLHRD